MKMTCGIFFWQILLLSEPQKDLEGAVPFLEERYFHFFYFCSALQPTVYENCCSKLAYEKTTVCLRYSSFTNATERSQHSL